MSYIKGIDVSRWQPATINWKKVKAAGYSFAFVKVTDGTAYKQQFIDIGRTHAKAAAAAGLKIGYYHFSHPAGDGGSVVADATAEAKYLLTTLNKDFPKPNFPLVLDFEDEKMTLSPADAKLWVATFAATLKAAGYDMIFYTYKVYTDAHLPATHGFGAIPLWIAQYPKVFDINKPAKPAVGWTAWTMWQYNEKGVVDGLPAGSVADLNLMDAAFYNKY